MPNGSSQARLLDRRAARGDDAAPIIPILARKVREVEAKAARGKVGPTNRTRFQVIALLVREERARVKSDTSLSTAARTELLKRLDGVATILARTAARDTSLLTLLDPATSPGPAAQRMRLDWLLDSGAQLTAEEMEIKAPQPSRAAVVPAVLAERQVVPPSVKRRLKASLFLAPVVLPSAAPLTGRLSGWDLMEPLYRSFEQGAGGGAASMDLPPLPGTTTSRRRGTS